MKSLLSRPKLRFAIIFAAFAAGTSIGWMDRYYWKLRWRYVKEEGLGLARAFARDFEKA